MDDQQPAIDEKRKPIPPLLYRYRPLPDDSLPAEEYNKLLEREKRIFTHRELYFPSPAKFNDPFDCRADMLQLPDTRDKQREEGLRILKNQNKGMPRQQRRALLRKYEKADIFQEVFEDEALVIGIQEEIKKYGVLCLSKVPNHILMWSHYTNGHKGFCLVFQIKAFVFEPSPDNHLLVKVDYNREYPNVPISVGPEVGDLDMIFRTKSPDWKYEEEWRVVWAGGARKSLVYPEGSLVGVILGCRMSMEHKRLLTKWTVAMIPRPMLIQARRKQREYGLDFFLVNPETCQEVRIDLNDLKAL